MKNNKNIAFGLTKPERLSLLPLDEIRIKKSKPIRTKFSMKKDTFDVLKSMSDLLNISEKSILDVISENKSDLQSIAEDYDSSRKKDTSDNIRKSKVISYNSLLNLRKITNKYSIPRNKLIEISILNLEKLLEDRIDNHKKALAIINSMVKKINPDLQRLEQLLGNDDPVIIRLFGSILERIYNLSAEIQEEIDGGDPVDPEDYFQSYF